MKHFAPWSYWAIDRFCKRCRETTRWVLVDRFKGRRQECSRCGCGGPDV